MATQRWRISDRVTTVIDSAGMVIVDPKSIGEDYAPLGGALNSHWSYEHIAPPEVFVCDVVELVRTGAVKIERTHKRLALRSVFKSEGVVIG